MFDFTLPQLAGVLAVPVPTDATANPADTSVTQLAELGQGIDPAVPGKPT